MAELLPCPFCGGEAPVVEGGINGRMRTYGLVEHKEGCFFLADGLPSKYQHVMERDFEAWNTRAERTCAIEKIETDEFGHWVYTSCGHVTLTHGKPSYCSTCGSKVVEE